MKGYDTSTSTPYLSRNRGLKGRGGEKGSGCGTATLLKPQGMDRLQKSVSVKRVMLVALRRCARAKCHVGCVAVRVCDGDVMAGRKKENERKKSEHLLVFFFVKLPYFVRTRILGRVES
ncbi:hypothetical protein IF1G_03888 [Cordyceps javanica]|uniref:Uncharacterized protein n=1 Tax=Cordyceps javanica TaxID=43265 RepID=A0A545V8V7_9HYPO|nr:hypothetical protein IF1G_03888 [Cordyceps javanica]